MKPKSFRSDSLPTTISALVINDQHITSTYYRPFINDSIAKILHLNLRQRACTTQRLYKSTHTSTDCMVLAKRKARRTRTALRFIHWYPGHLQSTSTPTTPHIGTDANVTGQFKHVYQCTSHVGTHSHRCVCRWGASCLKAGVALSRIRGNAQAAAHMTAVLTATKYP